VRPKIEAAFTKTPHVRVLLFEPIGAPEAQKMQRGSKVPKMTPGRAVLVALMHRYLSGVMDPWVSLLELHKLMYFAQESGQPLRLEFKPAHYGPYAENLRHVLSAIEGYFVSGYADGGDNPDKPLELVPGALEEAKKLLAETPETRARFDRVAEVVDGFETPSGMELLATVHWLATKESIDDLDALTERVHGWNERKRVFTRRQIGIAHDALRDKGWIEGSATAPEPA
jgi:O-acetyl-ADP-ribose deacetylase (regulator of RNase III)